MDYNYKNHIRITQCKIETYVAKPVNDGNEDFDFRSFL